MPVAQALVFRQSTSKGLRWIAAAGLFCFFPAYDLLIRPGVPVVARGMLPMWVIALGAGAMGLLFLTAAILGPARTIPFDPAAGELRDLGAAGFGLRWGRRCRFHRDVRRRGDGAGGRRAPRRPDLAANQVSAGRSYVV